VSTDHILSLLSAERDKINAAISALGTAPPKKPAANRDEDRHCSSEAQDQHRFPEEDGCCSEEAMGCGQGFEIKIG